jgi:hypothetical protein
MRRPLHLQGNATTWCGALLVVVSAVIGLATSIVGAQTSAEDRSLTADQQTQMIALLAEQRRADLATAKTDLERRAVEKGVALNEAHLRLMEESSRRLLERLADVLTPAQLARFAELEQRRLGIQRDSIRRQKVPSYDGSTF